MKKILITGGAGFVGRHFVDRLLRAGHEIHAVDNLYPGSGARTPDLSHPRFNFYRQDCREFFKTRKDDDFDYALHLAAVVGGRMTIEGNPLAVAQDLAIDAAYWEWAKAANPKKTVCFSSSAAYPVRLQRFDGYQLLKEEMIDFQKDIGTPDMTYGWAKLTCEYLAKIAYDKHGLQSAVYRPFSGYGVDQDDSYPFVSIIKRVIEHRGAKEIKVWGSGDQLRDFIHIDDCVEFVCATMDRINDASALNLSTGIYTSFKELAKVAAEAMGYKPRVVGTTGTPEGVFARGGDTTKQRSFGLKPKVDLAMGVREAVEYWSARRSKAA